MCSRVLCNRPCECSETHHFDRCANSSSVHVRLRVHSTMHPHTQRDREKDNFIELTNRCFRIFGIFFRQMKKVKMTRNKNYFQMISKRYDCMANGFFLQRISVVYII